MEVHYAALLLSDQSGHIIRCAVYEGTGKTKFKTRKEFSGSTLKQMDDACSFLLLNNNLCATFDGLQTWWYIGTTTIPAACHMETVWNYQDELYKLILDLQGGHLDGEEKSPDLLQSGTL